MKITITKTPKNNFCEPHFLSYFLKKLSSSFTSYVLLSSNISILVILLLVDANYLNEKEAGITILFVFPPLYSTSETPF